MDKLSRLILGISDPAFIAKNLVTTDFSGALRGPGNANGIFTTDDVKALAPKLLAALEEMNGWTRTGLTAPGDEKNRIAWPLAPFEDSTNLEKFAPTDESNVIAYGRNLFKQFGGRVLALGVGGSSNGPRVLTGAFQFEQAMHAGHTFSSDAIRATVKNLVSGEKRGHIIVTSLSGTTPETLTNLLISLDMIFSELQRAGIPRREWRQYVTVLTGGKDSVLRQIAGKFDLPIFYCKSYEGGRFSIWTVIGTLWAEANGVDSSVAKAGAMLSQYRIWDKDIWRNPAMLQAAIDTLAQARGITLKENLIFDDRLGDYGNFYAQAWDESVEEVNREGRALGLRARTDIGPNWQHIGAEGLLGVPQGVVAQLFWVQRANNPYQLHVLDELKGLRLGAGTLSDLEGKSLDDFRTQAVKGGWSSFVGRGIPTSLTLIPQLTPFTLGMMTQDTFGEVGFYGGANDLGFLTYIQPWVVLHKALGRGETDKVLTMENGAECAAAMKVFTDKFGA